MYSVRKDNFTYCVMISGMRIRRSVLGLLFIACVVGLIFYLEMHSMIPTFAMIQEERNMIEASIMRDPTVGVLIFSSIYITAIALSIPVATPLTVLSGFLFGPVLGTAVVAFSATVGGTIIFSLARFFFGRFFERKFGEKLEVVNRELRDNGFRDILLLRLTPIIPFSLINVATALTQVKLRDYIFATFIGTIPFTFVYVLAGTQLADIEMLSDILSLEVILVVSLLVVVAALPVILRRRSGN